MKEKSDNYVVDITDDDDDDAEDDEGNGKLMAAITASLKNSKNISIKGGISAETVIQTFIAANLCSSVDSWQDDVVQITISRNKLFTTTLKIIQRKAFSYIKPVCHICW